MITYKMSSKTKAIDPKNYKKLFSGKITENDEYSVQIFEVDEKSVFDLFFANKVDIALLDPLSYAKAGLKTDIRIITGPCISTINYTGLATFFFKQGLLDIGKCGSDTANDYLMLMSKILLSEKFGMELNLIQDKLSKDELLLKYHSALVWQESHGLDAGLDISEEWYDFYETPLPLAFWVCRISEEFNIYEAIVNQISGLDGETTENIIEKGEEDIENPLRQGQLVYQWDNEVEEALAAIFELLYFHQLTPEVADVKILGRD